MGIMMNWFFVVIFFLLFIWCSQFKCIKSHLVSVGFVCSYNVYFFLKPKTAEMILSSFELVLVSDSVFFPATFSPCSLSFSLNTFGFSFSRQVELTKAMVMEKPSPLLVGREFVRQYYTLLNQAPDMLHR